MHGIPHSDPGTNPRCPRRDLLQRPSRASHERFGSCARPPNEDLFHFELQFFDRRQIGAIQPARVPPRSRCSIARSAARSLCGWQVVPHTTSPDCNSGTNTLARNVPTLPPRWTPRRTPDQGAVADMVRIRSAKRPGRHARAHRSWRRYPPRASVVTLVDSSLAGRAAQAGSSAADGGACRSTRATREVQGCTQAVRTQRRPKRIGRRAGLPTAFQRVGETHPHRVWEEVRPAVGSVGALARTCQRCWCGVAIG